MTPEPTPPPLSIQFIPKELQVNILSYLRAYDLSAVQLTCRFYNDPALIHDIVQYAAENVYDSEFTKEIIERSDKSSKCTLEHLRNIELSLVARVLSLPEPKQGFYVSKSWIKKTLLWLESVNEPPTSTSKKKLNKKQKRHRARRLSDVSPPWPNVNSDLLCSHQNLQRCGVKAARSRRRLMDKQAWKILKKLYPDSTQLDSMGGECLQCLMEAETAKKNELDRLEQETIERKKPLADPLVRRFYTRTRGVPTECLVSESESTAAGASATRCPLKIGTYIILPRAWCHQWRKYMKTGEGSMPKPPESAALLCEAHKCALLPPHLEAFLNGTTTHLLSTVKCANDVPQSPILASPGAIPVGMQPTFDTETLDAMRAAGLSQAEIAAQRLAMLQLEQEQQLQQLTLSSPLRDPASINDLLDRENHIVVELVTEDEWNALLETGCWPKSLGHFAVRVTVLENQSFSVSTAPCRDCDPTGSRFTASAEVKYRKKRWEPKCVENKRIPRLEY